MAGKRYGRPGENSIAAVPYERLTTLCCDPSERHLGADLGLYSVTFNNNVDLDLASLEAYKKFRLEAERKGFRHFLEVFDPNAPVTPPKDLSEFINDNIARTLAGVTQRDRPLFLKIPYHGPEAMEMLASYDRTIVPGIFGGSSGTTFEAFQMLWEAKKYGAGVALYGRKINNSEHQLTFVKYLRTIADDQIMPDEAVRAYHSELERLSIKLYRTLDEDLQNTNTASSYSGAATQAKKGVLAGQPAAPRRKVGDPDFSKMTPADKVQWNLDRWKKSSG